jgi:hypothetical protein
MEQFCDQNMQHLGRHDVLLAYQLAKKLEQQLISRKQA